MTPDDQLIADLTAARQILEKGWCSSGLGTKNQPCLVGALNVAIIGTIGWMFEADDETLQGRRARACQVLQQHLPTGWRGLANFNDYPKTTKQDVLDLYDKTLADLGGL